MSYVSGIVLMLVYFNMVDAHLQPLSSELQLTIDGCSDGETA